MFGDVICPALPIERNKSVILENGKFLQLICESFTQKLESIATTDAAPANLTQCVLIYMKYKCSKGVRKGLQQAAFHIILERRGVAFEFS